MSGGFERRPGGGSLVQTIHGADAAAALPGKRTHTEQLTPAPSARANQRHGSDSVDGADARPATQAGLPSSLQARMEASFGADFSRVRIHAGSPDAEGVRASTRGEDIHFAPGEYEPDQPRGQHLIAHELAHVVQQRQGEEGPAFKREQPIDGSRAELEADRAADAALAGGPARVSPVGGGQAQAKPDDRLTEKEAAKLAKLTFEDAAERAHRGIAALEAFEGDLETRTTMYGQLVSTVDRIINDALDIIVVPEQKPSLYAKATLAAHNFLALQAVAPYEDESATFAVEGMKRSLGPGWKAPAKAERAKAAELDTGEATDLVRLNLEGAREDIKSSIELHAGGKEARADDIWGVGGYSFLARAIEVLSSKDLAGKRKAFRPEVERTRDLAVRLMDWAPTGDWSMKLRSHMNQLLGLVGLEKLRDLGASRSAGGAGGAGGGGGGGAGGAGGAGGGAGGPAKATLAELERFNTVRNNAIDQFWNTMSKRGAAVDEIEDEIEAKDAKPKSFSEGLAKALAIAALGAATGGLGAALGAAITDAMARGAVQAAAASAIKDFVSLEIRSLVDNYINSGQAGSGSAGGEGGKADGGWRSKDVKASFFFIQKDALINQESTFRAKFREATEPLAVEAHTNPTGATKAMEGQYTTLVSETDKAVRTQRKGTTASWATFLVQSQLGVIDPEFNGDPRKDEMAEMGYRGTDMREMAKGHVYDNAMSGTQDDAFEPAKANLSGMVNIEIFGDEGGRFTVKSATLPGINSKQRERIEVMNLIEAGIPVRIHGMVGRENRRNPDATMDWGHRAPLIITRNEAGSVMIYSDAASKRWLESFDSDYHSGAHKLMNQLLAKTIAEWGIKLGGG
jgi:hypothetical protein